MSAVSQFNTLRAGQIGPIEMICEGVYTAEAIAPAGEKMYFAMESIENFDKNKWDKYRNMAPLLVYGGCCDITIGRLTELGSRINDEIVLKEFLATRNLPDFWTSDQQRFEQLCGNLRERKIVDESPKAKELLTIPHASNGMNVEKQTHVVYVSKSPVTGRVKFAAQSQGFSGCVDKYGDLIMSVGVTLSDVVENRGIFRNPLSVVEGGYGAISMMTHSFTCLVVEENYPEVKIFKVRPLKKMGELFLNSLPKDRITINGIRGDVYDKGFEQEQNVCIPVEVLASLHRAR